MTWDSVNTRDDDYMLPLLKEGYVIIRILSGSYSLMLSTTGLSRRLLCEEYQFPCEARGEEERRKTACSPRFTVKVGKGLRCILQDLEVSDEGVRRGRDDEVSEK